VGVLGLIAGGGGLPVEVVRACERAGRPVFVIRLKGLADPALDAFAGADIGLAEFGRCLKALRNAGCDRVAFAGKVGRPDFASLKPDLKALRHLPAIAAAAKKGDDALLRALLAVFEKEGFAVESVQAMAAGLVLTVGPLGRVAPGAEHQQDIAEALRAAREIGRRDLGQAAVARGGVVLAVEGQAGTDALLAEVAAMPPGPRGAPKHRRGVLAKAPKPIQDRRVDLPTIGLATVEHAAEAGLAGIVGEAGGLLVVGGAEVREAADRLGLFVYGVPEPQP
jgi:hypothetical protein